MKTDKKLESFADWILASVGVSDDPHYVDDPERNARGYWLKPLARWLKEHDEKVQAETKELCAKLCEKHATEWKKRAKSEQDHNQTWEGRALDRRAEALVLAKAIREMIIK